MAVDYVLRHARLSDVDAIAALHAESWRSAYPGLVPDDLLGPGLDDQRLQAWCDRFASANPKRRLILAATSGDRLLGFTVTTKAVHLSVLSTAPFLSARPQQSAIVPAHDQTKPQTTVTEIR